MHLAIRDWKNTVMKCDQQQKSEHPHCKTVQEMSVCALF